MKSIRATCAPILLLCFGTMVRADLVPGALQLAGPVYLQQGAYVTIDPDGSFFSDLSCCVASLPNNYIVDIIGNFQAFDSTLTAVSSFGITGVSVTQGGGGTFNPTLEPFNLDGLGSATFTDSVNSSNQVIFTSGTNTLAFAFNLDPTYSYTYSLQTTGIPAGGYLFYDDVETFTPEPGFYGILALGIACLLFTLRRQRTSLR